MKQNSNVQPDSLDENLRDFILVIISGGGVETLRVRDIDRVVSGPSSEISYVYLRRENSGVLKLVVILEAARAFEKRCQNLLAALQAHNSDLINKFFAPPMVG
ncbi:hypothetical protein [Deinococcus cellulosilyticus]|uniref:Uncharacterized protein n=1 Tax=Deinococcus cellulosilyticus (strain DSM 18568 / NBRC 106333 / KACC 11606 / 5516J-15) TaxID=1223518 RepID=A0A511MYX3_DEIC1|nr:hypothetical protein [Deinococcus cellulosilyticus]GEM45712.1 hypothetical protein DC3_13470 [Deinococcus cellulosilyticus NBRC 106333 = KACC 11606]